MIKMMMVATVALLALSAIGCDDSKIDRRIDCIQVCNKADDCISEFDKSNCKEQCNDTDADAVDACDDCLDDKDSCGEKVSCAAACSGVLAETLFSK